MKGQMFEIMGFLIIAIAIIVVIVMMRVFLVGGFGKAYVSIAERDMYENTKAGVSSLLFMTEEKSGKSMQELIGIVAISGNTTVNFGPTIGVVDIKKELEWRMNALFGESKWNLKIIYPKISPDVQIVFVLDTSSSLCDDIRELAKGLPDLIQKMKESGKKVSATIYLLEGGAPCCDYTIGCDKFPQSVYMHCSSIAREKCPALAANPIGGGAQTEEDWGNGIACAIKEGPKEGWEEFSVKVGIPISDELPLGSECLGQNYCCASSPGSYAAQYNSLQNGIKAAADNQVILFPIKANPCGTICMISQGQQMSVYTSTQCDCSSLLTSYMEEAAKKTGGKMYALKDSSEILSAVNDIVQSVSPTKKPELEIGTPIPIAKNTRAVTVPVSVPSLGIHTIAYVSVWS